MAATNGEPPAVARQRVRRALRKAREATPLTQGDVATKLGWSLSKMQRIESAEVAVSLTDLRALLDVYGVVNEDEIARLSRAAQTSRRQRWVTPPEHREYLTPAMRQLLELEMRAVSIRAYQNVILPGVLQTPAVARAILDFSGDRLSGDARRVRFDVRMQRRKRLIEDAEAPTYQLILDESVIKRVIGGTEVMVEQLEALAAAALRPHVRIRMVPFSESVPIGLVDAFQIVNLSDADDDAVIYREFYTDDKVVADPAEVRQCRETFEEIWTASLTEADTVEAIATEVANLRTRPE